MVGPVSFEALQFLLFGLAEDVLFVLEHLLHDLVVGLLGLLLLLVGLEVVFNEFVDHLGHLLLLGLVVFLVEGLLLAVGHDETLQFFAVGVLALASLLLLLEVLLLVVTVLGQHHVFQLGFFLQTLQPSVLFLLHLHTPILVHVALLDLLLQVFDLLALPTNGRVTPVLPFPKVLAPLQLFGQVLLHRGVLQTLRH